jgi:RimJ/RimL family protein N-acetyltransferase/ketosteroid isomerase-like protein
MAHIPRPVALTLADAEEHIAQIHADQREEKILAWAITRPPASELIGIVCLLRMRKSDLRTEIGYALIRSHWGQGIMSEAVEAIVRHAFDTLHFHSIEAGVHPHNAGSIRVLEHNGFTQEAHFKEDTFHNGAFNDTLIYARRKTPTDVDSKDLDPVLSTALSQGNEAIAHRWFTAFNAHDLEQLLALYADDARHYSPKLKLRRPETLGLVKGKEGLRSWWSDSFERLPSLRYEVQALTADPRRVFMEYIRHVEGEEDLRVGEVLEVEHCLITASRVFHG